MIFIHPITAIFTAIVLYYPNTWTVKIPKLKTTKKKALLICWHTKAPSIKWRTLIFQGSSDCPLKLSLSISFSQLLHSNKHKTLSIVSFSFASDTNYHAFFLMSTEGGVWGHMHPFFHPYAGTNMHTHIHTRSPANSVIFTHSKICKVAAAPSNYRRWKPLTSCNIASPTYCCSLFPSWGPNYSHINREAEFTQLNKIVNKQWESSPRGVYWVTSKIFQQTIFFTCANHLTV